MEGEGERPTAEGPRTAVPFHDFYTRDLQIDEQGHCDFKVSPRIADANVSEAMYLAELDTHLVAATDGLAENGRSYGCHPSSLGGGAFQGLVRGGEVMAPWEGQWKKLEEWREFDCWTWCMLQC